MVDCGRGGCLCVMGDGRSGDVCVCVGGGISNINISSTYKHSQMRDRHCGITAYSSIQSILYFHSK